LRQLRKEVLVTFKPLPHLPGGLRGVDLPDQLRLTLGPDRMAVEMNVNSPNDPFTLERIALTHDLTAGRLPPYGEVLAGVLDADPLLSVRGDTAVECWRIVDPVLQAWREQRTPLDSYPAGSAGPASWT
jgi:glucose-6-phosphate 1-dehydrogenase